MSLRVVRPYRGEPVTDQIEAQGLLVLTSGYADAGGKLVAESTAGLLDVSLPKEDNDLLRKVLQGA